MRYRSITLKLINNQTNTTLKRNGWRKSFAYKNSESSCMWRFEAILRKHLPFQPIVYQNHCFTTFTFTLCSLSRHIIWMRYVSSTAPSMRVLVGICQCFFTSIWLLTLLPVMSYYALWRHIITKFSWFIFIAPQRLANSYYACTGAILMVVQYVHHMCYI